MKILVPMCADILHPGHINIIKEANKFGDVTVGLSTDKFIAELKGRPPLLPYYIRRLIVLGIKGVDGVVEMSDLTIPIQFDAVAHGDDWTPEYKLNGACYIKIPHTPGISSTLIKEKI